MRPGGGCDGDSTRAVLIEQNNGKVEAKKDKNDVKNEKQTHKISRGNKSGEQKSLRTRVHVSRAFLTTLALWRNDCPSSSILSPLNTFELYLKTSWIRLNFKFKCGVNSLKSYEDFFRIKTYEFRFNNRYNSFFWLNLLFIKFLTVLIKINKYSSLI